MIRSFDELPATTVPPRYDVLIVGSGPAGGVVARELLRDRARGLRIAVLESGLRRTSREIDALKAVESLGITIKDYSRERILGGASTTWAGLSAPLDPIEFEARPFLKMPGWPIPRSELETYWRAAGERYRFARFEHFSADGFGRLRGKGGLSLEAPDLAEKTFLAAQPPQDFGREWLAEYDDPRIDVWLGATVGELVREDSTQRARGVRVLRSTGEHVVFEARIVVLATGGIENARLLLASSDFGAAGAGNAQDQVGRGFMNHPKNYFGILELARPVRSLPYYFGCIFEGYAGYAGLRLTEDEQRKRGVLNSYVRLEPLFPWSDDRGVESLVLLVKRTKFLLERFQRSRRGEVIELRDYSETGDDSALQNERKGFVDWCGVVLSIFLHLPSVVRYAYYRVLARGGPPITRARIRNFMEMEPAPTNRVTLSEQRDAFGRRLARVEHRPSDLDRRSLVELHDALRAAVEQRGVGRLVGELRSADPWPIDQDASHHLGTTRMGDDPRSSVVDRDLKVHGLENVHCAGGSVFPISGCANPTFTIVALSIRLAEHLRARLDSEGRSGA